MAQKSGSGKRDKEYWKGVASKLAITLAIVILASGLVGNWMSSENIALDGCRNAREHLKNLNATAVEKLGKKKEELDECKKTIDYLEMKIGGLEAKIESLRDEDELLEDLEKSEKKVKELRQENLDLILENADLNARLDTDSTT